MAIVAAPDNDQHADAASDSQSGAAPPPAVSGDPSAFWSFSGPGWSPFAKTTPPPAPPTGNLRPEPAHSQTAEEDAPVSSATAVGTGAMHVFPGMADVATGAQTAGSYFGGPEAQTGTFGERYAENKRWLDLLSGESARQHPGLYYGSAIAPSLGLGAAFNLGMNPATMTLPKAVGIGSLWSAASGAGEGVSPGERAWNAGKSTLIGGPLSGIFHGVGSLATWLAKRNLTPEEKGMERSSEVLQGDAAKNRGLLRGQQDFNDAVDAGYPMMAMDLGGRPTKALARSVANMSQDARDVLENTVIARAKDQNQRMADLMDNTFGGATGLDTSTARDAILRNARNNNLVNYTKAYADPNAQAIWTPAVRQLMEAPQFRSVLSNAQTKAENYAALNGLPQPKNPFVINPDGSVSLAVDAQGNKQIPNLMYWDQVRRSLQDAEGSSISSGNKEAAKDWGTFKRALTGELDTAVPAYKTARQGAFEAFNAENALDAGLSYLKMPAGAKLDEMNKAIGNMSQAEKDEFTRGMAAAVKGKSLSTNDSADLLRQFNNPLLRQKFQTAFGPLGAAKVEASIRWENAMNVSNRAVLGNSTTSQQLADMAKEGKSPLANINELARKMAESGIAAREAFGGSKVAGAVGAAFGAANHFYSQGKAMGVNPDVLNYIAENLASGDKTKVNSMLTHIASRPYLMDALRRGERAAIAASGPGSAALVGGAGSSGSPQ